MNWRGIGIGLAAWGALSAAAAIAQPPGNTVSCTYDSLGAEDREIALLLIMREFSQGGEFAPSSRNVTAVNELIDQSQRKCAGRFGWSGTRSEAASDYALTAILSEAIVQTLQSSGRSTTPLEQFYRDHRLALLVQGEERATVRALLASHVRDHGWDEATDDELVLAWLYLETVARKDRAGFRFSAARHKP